MTGTVSTNVIKDGNGIPITGGVQMFDTSGVGTGPWLPMSIGTDANGTVVDYTSPASTQGDGLHGAAISGAPFRQGLRATTASWALSDSQTTDAKSTLDGKQVHISYAIPEDTWSYSAATGGITSNTSNVMVLASTSLRHYCVAIQYKNTSATASEFQITDGPYGTTLYRGALGANMQSTESITFPVPLRGSVNTTMEVYIVTTGTATRFNAQGYLAP